MPGQEKPDPDPRHCFHTGECERADHLHRRHNQLLKVTTTLAVVVAENPTVSDCFLMNSRESGRAWAAALLHFWHIIIMHLNFMPLMAATRADSRDVLPRAKGKVWRILARALRGISLSFALSLPKTDGQCQQLAAIYHKWNTPSLHTHTRPGNGNGIPFRQIRQ